MEGTKATAECAPIHLVPKSRQRYLFSCTIQGLQQSLQALGPLLLWRVIMNMQLSFILQVSGQGGAEVH